MRIYFDNCCLQRPLDDQTQPRIRVESEAVLALLNVVQSGDIILLNSEALEYEMRQIPDTTRRNEFIAVLALAKERLELTDATVTLAEFLENKGIDPMDAVHLALASIAKADFFSSCDDKLLKKAQAITAYISHLIKVDFCNYFDIEKFYVTAKSCHPSSRLL
jgi:predicted nucleic acid-binding protein